MTERERDRNAARRLAIIRHAQEVTGNVSKTCRYYGITRRRTSSGSGGTRREASRGFVTHHRESPLRRAHATSWVLGSTSGGASMPSSGRGGGRTV